MSLHAIKAGFLLITLLVVGKGEVGVFFFWHSTCQVGQHCILRVIKVPCKSPETARLAMGRAHVHWLAVATIARRPFDAYTFERWMLCLLDGWSSQDTIATVAVQS